MNNICCILNYAPHYRKAIYLLMEKELPCTFFFGNAIAAKIKKMDYNLFEQEVKELKYHRLFGHFNWLHGSLALLNKPYHHYIFTGEPYCLSTWVSLVWIKFTPKKAFLWSHGWYGDESWFKRKMKRVFFALADGILLYGDRAKELMVNEGISVRKLHVIYNSLDYGEQLQLRQKVKSSISPFETYFTISRPILIFIGRLTAVKKLHLLIQALNISFDRNHLIPFNLVIVGSGPEQDSLSQLVSEMNLDEHVWFYGACYEENKLAHLLHHADICVSPGNVGLTALHSLSYGTPVISHDNFNKQMPEFEVIQSDETGAFFKEGDAESLSKTISNWLEEHPQKTGGIRANCYSVIDEKYNPFYQVEVLKAAFSD